MNPDKIKRTEYSLHGTCSGSHHRIFCGKDDFKLFIYVCGAAIFVKLMGFSYSSPTNKEK